jgi:hypothetical protein
MTSRQPRNAKPEAPSQVLYEADPPRNADPVARLQYRLVHDSVRAAYMATATVICFPLGLPTRAQIRSSLRALAQFDSDRTGSLDGLANWLWWLRSLPEEEGSTSEDEETSRLVSEAMHQVQQQAAVARWRSTRSGVDLANALQCIVAGPVRRSA